MDIRIPPVALVKTWIILLKSENVDNAVKERARKMLADKIGGTAEILDFVKQNNIKLK